MSFSFEFPTRWADFDPNNHMRHSAYNDYAAEARVRLFRANGLSLQEMNRLNIGPVLFQERTNFLKEIGIGQTIRVEVLLKGCSELGERFKFLHRIYREDGILSAEIEIYAAWLDLKRRKLTLPPVEILKVLDSLTKTPDFEPIKISKGFK
ncbi:thioesterase family protein [Lutimonas saemankumensis]|uniref:acyl-CoA thioesterase n=1 Tax=Lutimonas saemankumensis TaxID=483016 RepID=UPI001CD1C2CF|nr:acyl-CoA thioesterase [Lutimonas saemankumensis]MCA0933417.1 thioesterase family protein [Lutimonas saemankumensis]